jgi:alpha-1,2-mannosyltransferase
VKKHRLLIVQLAVALLCVLALLRQFPSVKDFVAAIDHGDVPGGDFVFHYYPTARDSIRAGAPAGGFFYPAGFAVFLAPLGRLDLEPARVLWYLILAASVLWTATWVMRAVAPKQPLLAILGTALYVTSIPVLHDFKWGQVSVLIVATAATAFVLRAREKQKTSAALLGVAAAIKMYPLVFVGWFVLRRDWRFVARAAIACAITLAVLPAIVMGPVHALFFQRVATQSVVGAQDGVLYDFNSQFAPAVLARYYGGWGVASTSITRLGQIGAWTALAIIAGLLLLLSVTKAKRITERRELWAFVLLSSTVPFWLKTSWTHYFVHLPIAQVLLASTLVERRRPRDLAVLVLLVAPSVFLSNVVGLPGAEGWLPYAESGSPFFANLAVLVATALVVVDAHLLARLGAASVPVERHHGALVARPRALDPSGLDALGTGDGQELLEEAQRLP